MLSSRQLHLLDAVAAAVFAALGVASTFSDGPETHPTLAVALLLAGSLPVAVRRRWPRLVFGSVFLVAVVGGMFGSAGFTLYAAAFALYTVASTSGRPNWEPTLAIGIATGGLALLASIGGPAPGVDLGALFLGTISIGAAWTIGRAVRARRDYGERLLERHAEQAVAEDRLRIARDLHDVIAHSLSMITVKSGVAAHVAGDHPEQAAEALHTIETASRDTLVEVRRILDVLRTPGDVEPSTPTLAELPDLLEEVATTAGPTTRLVLGDPDVLDDSANLSLPFDVQLTAYRIVQEALTNVRRHSGATECEVRLTREADLLRIEVTDNGAGAAEPTPSGNGLRGMGERVRMYGGALEAANRPGGGFRVRAEIPLRTDTPRPMSTSNGPSP